MRPFRKAVYYEKIHCRSDEGENVSVDKKSSKSTEEKRAHTIPLNSRIPEGKTRFNYTTKHHVYFIQEFLGHYSNN